MPNKNTEYYEGLKEIIGNAFRKLGYKVDGEQIFISRNVSKDYKMMPVAYTRITVVDEEGRSKALKREDNN